MKLNPFPAPLCLAGLWFLTTISSLQASTIFWGTRPNDNLVDSSGNNLTGAYTFEIGIFDTTGGWAPTSSNLSEWSSRWMVFDAATDGNGWDPLGREVSTGVDHTVTGGSNSLDANPLHMFPQSTEAYLWVYNSKAIDGNSEWALVMDNNKAANTYGNSVIPSEQYVAWSFPNPLLQGGESFDWQTRDLDTAIFGGVNGVQGDGAYLVNPGVFTIQTHVVPEPSSALLIIFAGMGVTRRRRTRAKRSD